MHIGTLYVGWNNGFMASNTTFSPAQNYGTFFGASPRAPKPADYAGATARITAGKAMQGDNDTKNRFENYGGDGATALYSALTQSNTVLPTDGNAAGWCRQYAAWYYWGLNFVPSLSLSQPTGLLLTLVIAAGTGAFQP